MITTNFRIAVDNHISKDSIKYLESKGHKVVFRAENEMDNFWFSEALELGAEVFVSMDWDICFLCNKFDKKFIRLVKNKKNLEIAKFIEKKIIRKDFD